MGHVGFDKLLIKDNERSINTNAYTHYLHHKYFEVNYGDALVPIDKLFGTWHDGSVAGDEALEVRMEKKRQRLNASSGNTTK